MYNKACSFKFVSTKSCKAFRAMFPQKGGDTDGALNLSAPARGGPANDSEHVMTKQDFVVIYGSSNQLYPTSQVL